MGERIELVKRAFAGEAVERIPVMAHNFLMAVREAGFTQKQFRESPDVMVKAMTEATLKYDLDGVLLVDRMSAVQRISVGGKLRRLQGK